ncbi:MAG: TRAP transporter small permease [Planctomycetota bacterium]|nr:TRAP transporter small permease [Planctomycetota bacterium]
MKFVDSIIRNMEEAFIAAGISAASVVLFLNVVLRFGFNSGWEWAEEAARYTIVWIVFVGSGICARKGMHLAVDAVAIRLGKANRRILRMFVDAACVLFSVYLVLYGYEMVNLARETEQVTAGMDIPIFWVYLAIPVGGALMAIRFSQDFLLAYKREEGERAFEAS